MWHNIGLHRIPGTGLILLLKLCLLTSSAGAATPSALSKWLSSEAIPELRDRLQHYPRYQDQRIAIATRSGDALSEALVTLMHMNLRERAGIQLWQPDSRNPVAGAAVESIDALSCNTREDFDYLLQVSASQQGNRRGELSIQLLPNGATTKAVDSWHWKGKFSYAEQEYIDRPAAESPGNGSLAAPWRDDEVDIAARTLSRELACALRPQVRTHIALQWPEQTGLPGVFADTVNASRHLLGNYRELALTGVNADYEVSVELQRFRENTWQLWLIGTPRRTPLAPVQAVTYFTAADLRWPNDSNSSGPDGDALDFIDVEMLDATQHDSGNATADLEVTLRIGNLAQWPLEYSFTLSGGHFNHCIADPAYYWHDAYGKLEGSIDAGESVVRRLLITGNKHRPTPVFGTRKCAGFRDLDGFENFADRGYKVTNFVRWHRGEGKIR